MTKAIRDHAKAIQRAKERSTNFRVLNSAQCEKCTRDCRDDVALWVLYGLCSECRK